ncbi:MAG: T9SS type A sorting domain-containing protein [Bacteroidales bacterium]|nr:T9SS type A sorting domain-containing protein [Bacteroidales bacterium]
MCAFSGVLAQTTYLCNEKFSTKKPSGWDIIPAHSATAPSWKPDTGICVSTKYAMHCQLPINAGDTAMLVTPFFDFSNYKYVMIRFSHICKVVPSDICRIEYQEDVLGTANKWRPIPYDAYQGTCATYKQDMGFSHSSYSTWAGFDTLAKPNNSWWEEETFDVSDYVNYTKVRFRFIIRKGSSPGSFIAAGWYIDDFQVLASKSELTPPVVDFITNLRDTIYSAGPFTVKAKVATRTTAKIVQPYLAYSVTYDRKTRKDSIKMTALEGDSIWTATIPQQYYGTEIYCSIFGHDTNGNNKKISKSFVNKRFVTKYIYYHPEDTNIVTYNNSNLIYNVKYKYSQSRLLYESSDINPKNQDLTITRFAWYLRPEFPNANNVKVTRNLKIHMLATTDKPPMTATYMNPVAYKATEVYDGITICKAGWNEIILKNKFILPADMNIYIFIEGYGGTTSTVDIGWAAHNVGKGIQTTFCVNNATSWSSNNYKPLIRFGFGNIGNDNNNSVALASIDNPTNSTITGKQPVKITIQNKGDNWLDSCLINWMVNGILQPTVTWKGHLYTDFYDTISLGSYIQRYMTYDTITVWVSSPNNQTDSNVDDDTLTITVTGCKNQMKGSYTIGAGSSHDFPTLSDALFYLDKCGIGGDVTLKLSSGIYNENVRFEGFRPPDGYHLTITSIADNADSVLFRPGKGPVVSLNNSTGLTFRNLSFDARKVRNNCVRLASGLKDIEFYHCKLFGFDTNVNNNAFSTIHRSNGTPVHDIRFIGNEIIGGSYGIYFYGNSSTSRNSQILFDSNHIENYYSYAAYLYYNNNLHVTHNRFDGARSGNSCDYGFYSYYNDSSLFSANRFRNKDLNDDVYGLTTCYTDSFTVISNNEIIHRNHQKNTSGLEFESSSGIKVFNNSIIISGTSTYSYGIYTSMNDNNYFGEIKNNISVCLSSGYNYPLYSYKISAVDNYDVDYNCWWSKSNVGYLGSNIGTLNAFRSTLLSAIHDLYKQPLFVHADTTAILKNDTDLLCPNMKGMNTDINGKLRVTKTLMGAYTNDLPKTNIALKEIVDLPGTTFYMSTIHPYAVLQNAGTDTLREATIRVELDGVVQGRDIVWKGQLAAGETDKIPLGSFMPKSGNHQITAYLTNINPLNDTFLADDTAQATTYTCDRRMAGTYTVGGINANFSNPAEAIKALQTCGISAPVTLMLASATQFSGGIRITSKVPGSNAKNIITVMTNGYPQTVIINSNGSALSIRNSAHWHFRNITFGNINDGTVGVKLNGNVEDISFRNCNIYANVTTTYNTSYAVSYINNDGSTSYPADVEFVGNNIRGGYYNMYFYFPAGSTVNMMASSITIDSNTLSDAYYSGIYSYYYSHYKSMSSNIITNRKKSTSNYYGIINYSCSNVDKMENNHVHVITSGTGYGIYWYYHKNSPAFGGNTGTMANNEVIVEGESGIKYGICIEMPYQNWNVVNNSVFSKSNRGTVYGIYVKNSDTAHTITLRNNIFVTQSAGDNHPCYLNNNYTTPYVSMDYNNYFSMNNTTIGYAGSPISSFKTWKNTTGQDLHSVNAKPDFTNLTNNLNLNNYEQFVCPQFTNVTTDISGRQRTKSTIMGCYGFQIIKVDLQAMAFLSPQSSTDAACLTTSTPVRISVKNIGMKDADFSHSPLKISLDISGAINHHYDTTITKGSIAYQQTITLDIGTMPTLVSGIYNMTITLTDTSDIDVTNNTISMSYKTGHMLPPYDIDFSTEPYEFINVTMSGNTEWKVVKGNGSNPSIAPTFGNGRLEFAGGKEPNACAKAIFNGLDIHGYLKPTLSFWYAHSANCSGNDMLTVLATTDGGATYTELKRIRVADTATGWKQYDIDLSAFTQSSCLSLVFRAMSYGGANQSIDRIRITASQDAAISLLPIDISNRTACDSRPMEIKAVITNLSRLNIDMVDDTLTLNVTGAVNYSNKVVYNKRLGSFESDSVTLGQIALEANGAYYLEARMKSYDNNPLNDTIRDSSLLIMQDVAIDTILGIDNQMYKLGGEQVAVTAMVTNHGNIPVEQLLLRMSIDGNEVLLDTVRKHLGAGDTLVHQMSRPFSVPFVSKNQPYYFFELKADLDCDADNSDNAVQIIGNVDIPDSIDIQVLDISTTTPAIGKTKLAPTVRVANIGNLEADNIVVHVDVVNDSDRVVESISEMISHMAINETKNHAFTMTYKVPNYTGKYTLKAYAEAYSGDTIRRNDTISKAFDCEKGVGIAQTGTETWQLGQNIPNPATEITAIPFYLPQGGMVRLSVMGANGQVIYQKDFRGEAGSNQIELNTADLASGLYYYTMEYRGQRITRKMVIQ